MSTAFANIEKLRAVPLETLGSEAIENVEKLRAGISGFTIFRQTLGGFVGTLYPNPPFFILNPPVEE